MSELRVLKLVLIPEFWSPMDLALRSRPGCSIERLAPCPRWVVYWQWSRHCHNDASARPAGTALLPNVLTRGRRLPVVLVARRRFLWRRCQTLRVRLPARAFCVRISMLHPWYCFDMLNPTLLLLYPLLVESLRVTGIKREIVDGLL